MVRFVTSTTIAVCLLSGCLTQTSLKPDKSTETVSEESDSIPRVWDKLSLGMPYDDVVRNVGKPVNENPSVGFTAHWFHDTRGVEVKLKIRDEKVISKTISGEGPSTLDEAKTYDEFAQLLGEPDEKKMTASYSWTDTSGCKMDATFIDKQAVGMNYECPDGKFGIYFNF
jgi:hypothetical protein